MNKNKFLLFVKNIKVIIFDNGKFGIRKGWVFREFLDLDDAYADTNISSWIWRGNNSRYFNCCKGSKERVLELLKKYLKSYRKNYMVVNLNINVLEDIQIDVV
jgi:hypothetical protein